MPPAPQPTPPGAPASSGKQRYAADQRSQGQGVCSPCRAPRRALLEALVGESLAGLPRFGHRSLRLAGSASGASGGAAVFRGPHRLQPRGRLRTAAGALGASPLANILAEQRRAPLRPWRPRHPAPGAAMHLYGQEHDATTTPLKASWLAGSPECRLISSAGALEADRRKGEPAAVGLKLQGRAIARHAIRCSWVEPGGRDHQR